MMATIILYGCFVLTVFSFQVEATRFKPGDRYEYRYEVTTSTGVNPISAAGTKLSCTLVIEALRQNLVNLQVNKCKVEDRSLGKHFRMTENSDSFSDELSRNSIYFHHVEGEVVNHQIVVSESELQYIVNIKRGIVSLLQLPTKARKASSKSHLQHDIFGTCKTDFKFPEGTDNHVQTHRDLVTCNLAHINRRQSDFLSFVKTLKGGFMLAPITEMCYQFDSDVTCDYLMGNNHQLKQARCLQRQAYLPFTHEELNQDGSVTNISQTLKLISRAKLDSERSDEPMPATRIVDLAMDFNVSIEEHAGKDVERDFRATMLDFLGQGQEIQIDTGDTAQSFRRLVNTMRGMVYGDLRHFKDGIFACRNSTICFKDFKHAIKHTILKSVVEQMLINSLMSCGTHPCMDVFAECLKDNQIGHLETQLVLFNTGLFYAPSPTFIQTIFELCKIDQRSTCLLSLSAIISRVNESLETGIQKHMIDKIIFHVVAHLHQMIVDNCQPGISARFTQKEKLEQDERLLTALKALGNMGTAVNKFYNSLLDVGNKLTISLLQCLNNEETNIIVARTAMQAINSIGLNASIGHELFNILRDEHRPVVLRSSIFDTLLFYGNGVMLRDLLDLLDKTKMDHMRTYIVTRVSGLLEGSNPRHQNLRKALREHLKERVIPELEDVSFKSRFMQYSHFFTVPLTSLHIWGRLAFNVMYTPSSNLFQSLTITADWEQDDTTVKMVEVTLDLEGMDSILELLTNSSNIDWKEIFQIFYHNIHKAEFPQFPHFSHTVQQTLKNIFKMANFQEVKLPRAFLSFKINGFDIGWLTSDSLLKLIGQISKNHPLLLKGQLSDSIDILLIRAFNLFEVHKILPTVAGLPLDTHIDASVVLKSVIQKRNNHGSQGSFNFDFIFKPSASVFIQRSMQVSLMDYTKSRLSMKSSGLGSFDLSTKWNYQTPETPSDKEFKFHMTWMVGNEQVNFLNIKNDIYLKHNDKESRVAPHTRENKYVNCMPDIYSTVIGRRLCVIGSYYSPSRNVIDGLLNLMSSFRMEGSSVPDDENVKHYSVVASWHSNPGKSGFHFRLILDGPGTELSRLVNITLITDHIGSIKFECSIPDAEIKYRLERKRFDNSTHHHHTYASVLSQESTTLSSFLFERKGYNIPKSASLPDLMPVTYDQSSDDVHFNLNLRNVSLDLRITGQRPSATHSEKTVLFKYHCEPSLKLLYSLHPSPILASNEGHTSVFSYHHEIMDSMRPLEKTWMAFYKVVVIWPDTNITMTTTMTGDTKRAHRLTDVTWTYGDKMDLIQMISDVTNKSTHQMGQYDYILHLSNRGKFDLDLVGHLQSQGKPPFRNVAVRTDVRYMEKGGNNRKAKSWWHRWWKTSKKLDFDDSEKESVVKNHKKKELYFWRQPTWSFGIDFGVQMFPHKSATSEGGKEAGDGGKVAGDGGKVAGDGGKVTGDGGKVTGDGGKVTGDGGKVMGDGGKVTGDGGKVMGDGGKVMGDGGKVAGDGGKVTGDGGKVMGDGGKVMGDGGKVTGDGGKVTGDGGKVTGDDGKVTEDGGKVTGDGGKVTGDGGKVTEDGGKVRGDGGKVKGAGGKVTGIEFQWLINASLPRDGHQLFKTNGSVVNGIKKWMIVDLEDNFHDLVFNWQAEYLMTPMVFHHHHNWTLVETSGHTFDRSFNMRIDFEHYQHLEYDVVLVSPRLKFTHHINYSKISELEHQVRAHIDLHSAQPAFDLLYFESTDLNGTDLTTNINLTSSLLDYKLELDRKNGTGGLKFTGNLTANGRLLKAEKRLSMSLALPSNNTPRCELMYIYDNTSGLRLDISIQSPTKVRIEFHSLSTGLIHNSALSLANLSLELTQPRILLTTLEFSNLVTRAVRHNAGTLQKTMSHLIKQEGHTLANNIVADLQDKIWPFLNQSMASHMKAKLYDAVTYDFDGKTIQFYKIGLGAVEVVNKIWLDNPIIQAMKLSHVDEAMASSVIMTSQIVSHWIRHPPFFVRQFAKAHVLPALEKALNDHLLTFSICLPVAMPSFNAYPHLSFVGKEVIASLRHRMNVASQMANDVGIIMAGQHIRTFDGLVYDVIEPPRKSCTYLLAADLKNGRFSLTYTKGGLTVVSSSTVLTLARDGSLASMRTETINYIPYFSPSGDVALDIDDGYFHLSFASGLASVVFSPVHDFYIVTVDRTLNNVSLGILGTNNRETGDDHLLPDGTLADSDVTFQNSFELTGNNQCRVSSAPSMVPCNSPNVTANLAPCSSLTNKWPAVVPCLRLINAKPFIQQCQIDVCKNRSGCNVVLAYLTACRSKGLDVGIPHSCQCTDSHSQDTHGLDVVFIQSLHHSLIRSHHSLDVVKHLSSSMTNSDLNIGLITYGGERHWKNPKAHLLNGKLLEKWKLIKDDLALDINPGHKHVRPKEAIIAAANFPFRSSAAKVIVLAYGHEHEVDPKKDEDKLELLLKRKGITLVAASTHPAVLTGQNVGLMSNGQVIGEEKYIPTPKDAYSHLVLATGGMWLNLDTIIEGNVKQTKHIANQLKKLENRKTKHQCD